jgi:REP element-mobilizing transposase RayT
MPQSLAKVYLHVNFSTKDRAPTLAADWREELFQVLGGVANNSGCRSLVVGGVVDHVHLLFQLPRTLTIADAVRDINSNSSAWVNQTKKPETAFHWQSGYGAFSVSQSAVAAVREYIDHQPEHHERQSFQDEFREWLRRYEIEWDERYVWD